MVDREPHDTVLKSWDVKKDNGSNRIDVSFNNKIDLFSIGILNSLSAHIAVLDTDGNIIAVNNAWEKFAEHNGSHGKSVRIGSNYFNVSLKAVNSEEKNDALHALKGIQKVLSGEMEEFEYEYACHSPDEKRWFLMRVTPMQFIGNKAVVSHINITDKKIAEMNLIEREKELSALNFIGRKVSSSISLETVVYETLEQISAIIRPDLAMIFIKEGQDLMLKGMGPKNQAYKFKISDKHRVGQCLCGLSVSEEKSIFSDNLQTDSRCTWNECKVAGFISFAAIPFKIKEEVIGTLGMGSIVKRNFKKRQHFLEAIVSDVSICLENSLLYEKVKTYAEDLKTQLSDRKKMEKVLIHTQKMEAIGHLAGGIAHDFNNILTSIIGFTELALEDVKNGTTMEDNLQQVYSAGMRAKDLVSRILAFARKSEEKIKPMRVDGIITETLNFLRSSIPSTIKIKQNINSDSMIMGNPTQVHQLIMNLCTNAAQAMETEGGVLEVSLEDVKIDSKQSEDKIGLDCGDYIIVEISDTGHGIAPEILESIFDPYFTTKTPGTGTGMGLSVVLGIVKGYGGKVTVESKLGHGTVFSTYLPITKKREYRSGIKSDGVPLGTERVLFLDDEASIAMVGNQILGRLGYSVTTRTSSLEGLELFRSRPNDFDLVITDMTMPDMTGDRLAVELMKIRPDIPVILCTGYSKMISNETASGIGIKAFAHKPLIIADLAKVVRNVLDEAKTIRCD